VVRATSPAAWAQMPFPRAASPASWGNPPLSRASSPSPWTNAVSRSSSPAPVPLSAVARTASPGPRSTTPGDANMPRTGVRSFSPTVLKTEGTQRSQNAPYSSATATLQPEKAGQGVSSGEATSTAHKLLQVSDILSSVNECVSYKQPTLTKEGSGGTYVIRSPKGQKLAIFKPCDEEPGAVNNPRKNNAYDATRRQGFLPGEGATKEVVAYMLDIDGVAGVPPTALAEIPLRGARSACKKLGSLQKFVDHKHESWAIGPSAFDVDQVHAIALLDLRLLNGDRHGGNILVCYENDNGASFDSDADSEDGDHFDEDEEGARESKLVPIDHGYCLPAFPHVGGTWLEWATWPQCRRQISRRLVEYVASLDGEADAQTAKSLGLRDECCTTLRVGTLLVKRCVAAGLTLREMARIASRMDGPDTPSPLEVMCNEAERVVGRNHHHTLNKSRDALILEEIDRLLAVEIVHTIKSRR